VVQPADITARRAWEAGHELAAVADPILVEALLLTSTQPGARLATPSEVASVTDLARAALDDPFAESLAGLMSEGFDVERRDRTWIVRGDFRNTMRIAARVVTEFEASSGVTAVASNGSRSTIMVRRDNALIMADSVLRQWRTYSVRFTSTPASMFTGSEGVPPAQRTTPLSPTPPHVLSIALDAGCDIEAIAAEFLRPAVHPRPKHPVTDRDW